MKFINFSNRNGSIFEHYLQFTQTDHYENNGVGNNGNGNVGSHGNEINAG